MDKIKRFFKDEEGVSAVEYALLLALVGAGIAAAALALGQAVGGKMGEATTTVSGGGGG
ncbi:MAG: Flp family type IVb pilin [Proteobacteria bacterium]|nr:Flp family type IVb pilin [Pseudomonadota bacterium]